MLVIIHNSSRCCLFFYTIGRPCLEQPLPRGCPPGHLTSTVVELGRASSFRSSLIQWTVEQWNSPYGSFKCVLQISSTTVKPWNAVYQFIIAQFPAISWHKVMMSPWSMTAKSVAIPLRCRAWNNGDPRGPPSFLIWHKSIHRSMGNINPGFTAWFIHDEKYIVFKPETRLRRIIWKLSRGMWKIVEDHMFLAYSNHRN